MNNQQLQELENFLNRSGEEALNIEQLHGYLTCIIIGPDMVMPSNWMPHIFRSDGDESTFNDLEDAQEGFSLLMGFYNDIIHRMDNGDYEPMFGTWDDKGKIITDPVPWCQAFVSGMSLCADRWFEDEEDEALATLLEPIMHFSNREADEKINDLAQSTLFEKTKNKYLSFIPKCVLRLREYWREKNFPEKFASENDVPFKREQNKVGRNEPCPCGSGKKYKKCCGNRD